MNPVIFNAVLCRHQVICFFVVDVVVVVVVNNKNKILLVD